MKVKPRENINRIHPYKPGKPEAEVQRELGLDKVVKLASNENSLGPSPKAVAAMHEALGDVFRYPEGSGHYLVLALADKFGLSFDHIILGNGANDLVELVVKTFAGPGDNVVSGRPSFIIRNASRNTHGTMAGSCTQYAFLVTGLTMDAMSTA